MLNKKTPLNLREVSNFFTHETLLRGLECAANKQVKGWSYNDGLIQSEVKGSTNKVYQQEIHLIFRDQSLIKIDNDCTCSSEFDCEHVVATLVAVIDHQHKEQDKSARNQDMNLTHEYWLRDAEHALNSFSTPLEKSDFSKIDEDAHFACILSTNGGSASLRVLPAWVKENKSGDFKASRINLTNSELVQLREQHAPVNWECLAWLQLCAPAAQSSTTQGAISVPANALGHELLNYLSTHCKLYWSSHALGMLELNPLQVLPNANPDLAWVDDNEGGIELQWRCENEKIHTISNCKPAWFITSNYIGVMNHVAGLDEQFKDFKRLIQNAPKLKTKQERAAFTDGMIAAQLERYLPLPQNLPQDIVKQGPIKVKLHLDHDGLTDYAQVEMIYPNGKALWNDPKTEFKSLKNRRWQIFQRDEQCEADILNHLASLGFSKHASTIQKHAFLKIPRTVFVLPSEQTWIKISQQINELFPSPLWEVELGERYRFNLELVDEWYADIDEGQQNKTWFDLEIGIVVQGKKISLLPILLSLMRSRPEILSAQGLANLSNDDMLLAQLPSGRSVALEIKRLRPMLSILGELFFHEDEGDRVRLNQADVFRLSELNSALPLQWKSGHALLELSQRIQAFTGLQEVNIPQELRAELRDYQREGVAWMQFLREFNLNGILADDMGLGKTLQTLTHILCEKTQGRLKAPALVIAPTSLIQNWFNEAARFTPSLNVLSLHNKERAQDYDKLADYDIVLTTYALAIRDEATLLEHEFHLLILDEAHYIKNALSKAARTLGKIRAQHKLCLTGTPIQNHLGELWSLFNFSMPGFLGDSKFFNTRYRTPIEKHLNLDRQNFLLRKIKPFILRRTKDMVARELPAKTEIDHFVQMSSAQADLYETIRIAMDERVREEVARNGMERSQILILDALLKLRQVCCDPRLVTGNELLISDGGDWSQHSAKLMELLSMLEKLVEEGRRVLVFSQFTSMLEIIAQSLQANKLKYLMLTGETENRSQLVDRFQSGECSIFLISLKAGGVGLNLTAADTVIHYDPWWNPAAENQASDRAWRIGQDKPVFVYRLICKASVEEKIQALQKQKSALAESFFAGTQHASVQFTGDDLQAIFAALPEHEEV